MDLDFIYGNSSGLKTAYLWLADAFAFSFGWNSGLARKERTHVCFEMIHFM